MGSMCHRPFAFYKSLHSAISRGLFVNLKGELTACLSCPLSLIDSAKRVRNGGHEYSGVVTAAEVVLV